ncbi:hypothetical protein FQA47_024853 [Oryzias melastigma]|uniref:Uncharacterized protein n=1 Tax=Oryzias melastigma TaxID=30732 RepID=A0A834FKR5_ORYME|nr:hypothetical protein FQA47_024853 [Oryzias melastigma]
MWQQAALPHPPLPVSHGQPDDKGGRWQQRRWTPLPPLSKHTHTLLNTPLVTGFAINSIAGGNIRGGGERRRRCCRNAEIRDRIQNLETKAHNSPVCSQSNLYPDLSALRFDQGHMNL